MSDQNQERSGRSTRLHNMSCSPSTRISHRSCYRRPGGPAHVFSLPSGTDTRPEALLKRLKVKTKGLSPEQAEEELRRRIDEWAVRLNLPAVALVTSRAEPGDRHDHSLAAALVVLSKSSDSVFLRGKEPNLAAIRAGRRVVLLAPAERRNP